MNIQLKQYYTYQDFSSNCAFLLSSLEDIPENWLSSDEAYYLQRIKTNSPDEIIFPINRANYSWFFILPQPDENIAKYLENIRLAGYRLNKYTRKQGIKELNISSFHSSSHNLYALAEGIILSDYSFQKYRNKKNKVNKLLESVYILSEDFTEKQIQELQIITEAVYFCRDLVNEIPSKLNAETLAEVLKQKAEEVGMRVEVMNKEKIESLRMGGLLGVNKGSSIPPTFTVLEWKHPQAINRQPIVFIGKGITFDSGGMNIKTGTYMENMKSDMAGAATVASVVIAAARLSLPIYVLAFIPATDNRINSDAIVPGEIITMYNETTVEVVNTDAEGRLILADALSYASKFDPLLTITAATLTGAAARAIGKFGIVVMQSKAKAQLEWLKKSGEEVYERLVEFPLWEEYFDLIKSDIADIKNSGPAEAGAITAGKFLEYFTSYPFIHLDIAGTSYTEKYEDYRGIGATGTGVRLLISFLQNFIQNTQNQ
ncbi:MAG TPA: leucyl aminopeptidase [Bacteroidales bacterium]|nr:leucyl aminopeptidase [Bacteroidales bacterium]